MATYGIKVSQEGHNVQTCDDNKLIITSEKEHLKIKYAGELNLVLSNDQTWDTITFNHNLGYYPLHYVFFKLPAEASLSTRRICKEDERGVFEATTTCRAYITKTQLVCSVDRGSYGPGYLAGKTVNFKYYIFANNIEQTILGPYKENVYGDISFGG